MANARGAGYKVGNFGGKLAKLLAVGCGGVVASSFVKNVAADKGDMGRAFQDTWNDLGSVARGMGVTAEGAGKFMFGDGSGDKGLVGDSVDMVGKAADYASRNADWLVPTAIGGGVLLGGAHMLGFGGKGGFLDWAKKGSLAGAGLVLASKLVLPRLGKGAADVMSTPLSLDGSSVDERSFSEGVTESKDSVETPDASRLAMVERDGAEVDMEYEPGV